ncbi:MAG: ferritin family protein [Phycisphaerae bacterium]|jgi:rubrerythrin
MAQTEPDSEIFEFAIFREIAAYHFYMALAKVVSDPQMRKVLEDFAKEELGHKEQLELEILKMGKVLPAEEDSFVPSEADSIPDADSLGSMDYRDILLLAIEKEEASFRTYVDLLPHVTDPKSKEVLLAIAEEEVKHKLRFEIEYSMLTKKA